MTERLLRKIAAAIWTADGAILRLLDEPARPDTNLTDQQAKCWRQARAVLAALEARMTDPWHTCPVGSCQRHQACMYARCRAIGPTPPAVEEPAAVSAPPVGGAFGITTFSVLTNRDPRDVLIAEMLAVLEAHVEANNVISSLGYERAMKLTRAAIAKVRGTGI